jgi:hypothetical protein
MGTRRACDAVRNGINATGPMVDRSVNYPDRCACQARGFRAGQLILSGGMVSAREAHRTALGEPECTIVVGSPRELPPTPWTRLHDESGLAGNHFRSSRSGLGARPD